MNVDVESEKVSIQKVIDEHLNAIDCLDINRIIAVQTSDHLDMPPNMKRVVGQQAYIEYFKPFIGFFNNLKSKEMSFKADEFEVTGDWAFQIGSYRTHFVLQDDNVMQDEGELCMDFQKRIGW